MVFTPILYHVRRRPRSRLTQSSGCLDDAVEPPARRAGKETLMASKPRPITGRRARTASLATGRTASLARDTAETQIRLQLNLDGGGVARVNTGIPFLDHMLTQLAKHGQFDLTVEAT